MWHQMKLQWMRFIDKSRFRLIILLSRNFYWISLWLWLIEGKNLYLWGCGGSQHLPGIFTLPIFFKMAIKKSSPWESKFMCQREPRFHPIFLHVQSYFTGKTSLFIKISYSAHIRHLIFVFCFKKNPAYVLLIMTRKEKEKKKYFLYIK